MRVIISPSELDINPELGSTSSVKAVLAFVEKRGPAHLPLGGSNEEDVSARRSHLVALARMNSFFLDGLYLQVVQLHIKHLAQVHDDRLVDLLPQVSSEDLYKRYLQSG